MQQSGLQYEILKEDKGAPLGTVTKAMAHYKPAFTDGKVCQSSYESANTFKLDLPKGGVIKGRMEAVPLM